MPRLVDKDRLSAEMYHEAFETNTHWQTWNSGCWIRYRLFEEVLKRQPTVDAVEVVRCKDCRLSTVTELRELYCYRLEDIVGAEDYCSRGERKEDEQLER